MNLPFGPEIIGDVWWDDLFCNSFALKESEEWIPVYAAFGGLSIFKTEAILPFSYSGIVSENLKKFYEEIFSLLPLENPHRQHYLKQRGLSLDREKAPIRFQFNSNSPRFNTIKYPLITCCEHVNLFASMRLKGFDKIFHQSEDDSQVQSAIIDLFS